MAGITPKIQDRIDAINGVIDQAQDKKLREQLIGLRNHYLALTRGLDEIDHLQDRPLKVHIADFETPITCKLEEYGQYQLVVRVNNDKRLVLYKSAILFIELGE